MAIVLHNWCHMLPVSAFLENACRIARWGHLLSSQKQYFAPDLAKNAISSRISCKLTLYLSRVLW